MHIVSAYRTFPRDRKKSAKNKTKHKFIIFLTFPLYYYLKMDSRRPSLMTSGRLEALYMMGGNFMGQRPDPHQIRVHC
jgi:hypothetical protein